MNKNVVIKLSNVEKFFKIKKDKPTTLMESILFFYRNKAERHKVLNNISLSINKGETVALIGSNGCGKSTTLKLISKILYPNSGIVETKGKVTSLLELGAGFHNDFTGRENIYFNASLFGLTKKEIDSRLDEIIEFSELGDFIDTPVRTYSSGMYLRLAFSVAINVDADILLIDEILAVGDQKFQEKCLNKIKYLTSTGKTIVFVSHGLGSVKELCNRAIWFYNGNIEADGEPSHVINQYLERINSDLVNDLENQKENAKYTGIIFLDHPKTDYKISKSNNIISVNGWAMCSDINAKIMVIINGFEFTCSRYERLDVLNIYNTEFGGELANKLPGFKVDIEIDKLNLKNDIVTIEVNLVDRNNSIVASTNAHIELC